MANTGDFKKVFFISGVLFIFFRPVFLYAYGGDYHDRHNDRHDRYYHYHEHPQYGMRIDFISNDYVPVVVDRERYYYYDGLYYAPAGHGEYVLVQPPVGAIVPAIPSDYRVVRIDGVNYYTDSGVYYVFTRHGYRVVDPPVVRVVPQTVVVEQTVPAVVESPNKTKVAEGATLGGVLGALTGGIIGHQMKGHHTAEGALVGGVAGAVVGGVAGSQIPNQSALTPAPIAQSSSEQTFTVNVPDNKGGYIPVVLKKSGSGYVGPQGEYYSEFPKVSQLQAMYSK